MSRNSSDSSSSILLHQASQYILNRKLGADAYGVVYAAEHPLHRIADRAEEWSRSSVKGPTRRMSRIPSTDWAPSLGAVPLPWAGSLCAFALFRRLEGAGLVGAYKVLYRLGRSNDVDMGGVFIALRPAGTLSTDLRTALDDLPFAKSAHRIEVMHFEAHTGCQIFQCDEAPVAT
mgnify:CR=1 FL=1